jgi:hypothetical protein
MNRDDDITDEDILTRKGLTGRQRGNYLDILALSVVIFFLTTTYLTKGQLFSNFSTKYDGKSSVYKYVDAESVLQQDFTRVPSSVIF